MDIFLAINFLNDADFLVVLKQTKLKKDLLYT